MLRAAFYFGLLLRLGVTVWNGYWGPSYGAEADAAGFHAEAVAYALNPRLTEFVIGHIYSYGLGLVYYVLTDSLFLGGLCSVIAWAISAGLFLRLMILMGISTERQWRPMLVYSILPSSVLLTSITLREAYQMLFVNLLLVSILSNYRRSSGRSWIGLGIGLSGMGVLHGALLASGFIVLASALMLSASRSRNGFSPTKVMALFMPMILLLSFGFELLTNIGYDLEYGVNQAVLKYQEGTMAADGRATYRNELNLTDGVDLILSIPIFLFQYLFEPMPWRELTPVDTISILENLLRAIMLWRAINFLRLSPAGHRRRLVIFVLLALLTIETVWSLGVSNWGTGLRHHLPSLGLLLVVGFSHFPTANANLGRVPARAVSSQPGES